MVIWIGVAVIVAGLAYVRLAPVDVEAAHQSIDASQDSDGAGHAIRVIEVGGDGLARVDQIMRALPRTVAVAGSVAEGRVSYVTRSKWIGFPDVTTIEQHGAQLRMFARLRFGQSDFGANRARLEQVIAALDAA